MKEVNVKWLANNVYIPKLGTYIKGEVKPMPEDLAKNYEGTGDCKIISETKTTKDKGE